jgi:hypothetical protein
MSNATSLKSSSNDSSVDALVRKVTAFRSFAELQAAVNNGSGYYPTLRRNGRDAKALTEKLIELNIPVYVLGVGRIG